MLFEQPVTELKFNGNTLSFSIDIETIFRFEGVVENGKIAGSVKILDGPPDMKIGFSLMKQSDKLPQKTYSIEKLSINRMHIS